jgi:uncharacterized protein YecE (DUF72 family)
MVHIGCSGYNYREWKGLFYPEGLPQSKWLEFYCQQYNTVEINASFYKVPTVKSLTTWYKKTPENFRFSLKANKLITHYKKFVETQTLITDFYDIASEGLKDKLDCILFQLPPSLTYTRQVLDRMVDQFNPAFKNVLEFRHASWWNEEVYSRLKEHELIFCITSYPGLPEEFIQTAGTVYMRLHGNTELYKSNYSDKELKSFRDAMDVSTVKDSFIYFDNTWGGNAIKNAKTMQKLMDVKHNII